ncbi:unnamed protein product [Pleuronectes platessa]|uniref:Uncharacterized protein n=1 Tax=Pleuronectes platessa TaxID=8262 RepID=A0A9N7UIQ6_PLEPL|nr:unnamed protein product [Pleuronectes platessa]
MGGISPDAADGHSGCDRQQYPPNHRNAKHVLVGEGRSSGMRQTRLTRRTHCAKEAAAKRLKWAPGCYASSSSSSSSNNHKPPEGAPPREQRVPPAGGVAEVIRQNGQTCVQSRCRLPPYPVPSNLSPPSAPGTDTAPQSKRKKAPAPATYTASPFCLLPSLYNPSTLLFIPVPYCPQIQGRSCGQDIMDCDLWILVGGRGGGSSVMDSMSCRLIVVAMADPLSRFVSDNGAELSPPMPGPTRGSFRCLPKPASSCLPLPHCYFQSCGHLPNRLHGEISATDFY